MSDLQFNPDLEDDEAENSENDFIWGGRDATIFLINACPQMMIRLEMMEMDNVEEDDMDSHFVKAVKCVYSAISRKIISNDSDLSAVVFYNSDKDKNELSFPHIYVLQNLDRPSAQRIIELRDIAKDENNRKFDNSIGKSNAALLHDVFWVCRNIFVGSKTKLSSKNILLFTCEDAPHAGEEQRERQAMTGARDLREAGVELEVLPMGQNFDMGKFYKELLTFDDTADEQYSISAMADPTSRFDELLERVRRLEHKQRSSGKVAFQLAPGLKMGVKVFTAIRKAYKPSRIKLYKGTNEEVRTQKKEYLEETGSLLFPSDIVKYQTYSGKKIKFTLDEVKSISRLYEPGIELLGFKPITAFKPFDYIKPANFIYPDEDSYKGSNVVFSCLLDRCITRKLCPITRVVARSGSSVSWAFLLPQKEVKDDSNCQLLPPGFHICYLPFADDFRNVSISPTPAANTQQVSAAKEVLKRLHFKYNPNNFDNPDLQTHWRNVETLALNLSYLDPVEDFTVPNHSRMQQQAVTALDEFRSLVLSDTYDAAAQMKKRAPAPPVIKGGSPPAKRLKGVSSNVEELANKKMVAQLNMDALKIWLQGKGVRVTGKKKAQLVQDVYDHLEIQV